jgi:hypothetical protein
VVKKRRKPLTLLGLKLEREPFEVILIVFKGQTLTLSVKLHI